MLISLLKRRDLEIRARKASTVADLLVHARGIGAPLLRRRKENIVDTIVLFKCELAPKE